MALGWFEKLKQGLAKTSARLTDGVAGIFTGKRRLDDAALEELEDVLIGSDLGPGMAARMTAELARTRFDKEIGGDEVREAFAAHVTSVLEPVAKPLVIDRTKKPHVVLVVGVNGSGKTTTIGKLAKHYKDQGLTVMLAAGDTFRAAAVEQLKVWGERTGCPVIARNTGSDAASLAFEALTEAKEAGVDVLLVDTAGRLHNKAGLMQELQKVVRVLGKQDDSAPHDTVMVLDATVGQNALQQVKVFGEMVKVTGLVVTKLDGTAKGGVLVALADTFGLPVHAIGVGEQAEDMRPFEARDFARSLMGLSANS
ncbi:MAG TPA: signal recognition particle-docking protein FtsY [Rhodospirillaceae bacterium]|nr:signal recognition particle-docking protein FtsY [Rhodospirillaceae bacterium]MAX64157.1 signal recognition particle-docking protein FtsY [Rhodospirillaceae bacterium]MBB57417.1 signal recognition particle-docking protein FtsY [Rhodospirillaceae bacterium]HAE02325.1 signal recognition particle-docking protein FtsY [Rhodospirillaceae bacterium]HBM11568.1 signal recognition particle-docking protein FtsY [Rhodospirillaceae bacterium]|tara:strand:- start:17422 stop:18354 length:933 start_codon:yes stop_codon:yes gene_type:complete